MKIKVLERVMAMLACAFLLMGGEPSYGFCLCG